MIRSVRITVSIAAAITALGVILGAVWGVEAFLIDAVASEVSQQGQGIANRFDAGYERDLNDALQSFTHEYDYQMALPEEQQSPARILFIKSELERINKTLLEIKEEREKGDAEAED